jgi:hypothetical protein
VEEFNRPDIAKGIFFEYLRTDDPMSTEFVEHVVDGFPFLLAPLAQVKGVTIGQSATGKSTSSSHPILDTVSSWGAAVTSKAMNAAAMVQHGAIGAMGHATNAAKIVGEASHHAWKDLDRRRDIMVKHVVTLPETIHKIVTRREDPIQSVTDWVASNMTPSPDESEPTHRRAHGRAFGYPLSRWFGEMYYAPDEIGPMVIHPTMDMTRKVFLSLVHLYLLLLFIVSFPGSQTTRTKLLIRKCQAVREMSESESDDSGDDACPGTDGEKSMDSFAPQMKRRISRGSKIFARARRRPWLEEGSLETPPPPNPLQKKSLSYFL